MKEANYFWDAKNTPGLNFHRQKKKKWEIKSNVVKEGGRSNIGHEVSK